MKAQAALTLTREGETLTAGEGEVLFTEYGVSGPAVFDLSRAVAAGGDGLTLHLDFLPGWSREDTLTWLRSQRTALSRQEAGALLTGGVHPRLGRMLCKAAGISGSQPVSELTDRQLEALCRHLGLDLLEAAAFGDGTNDLTMIQKAGVGVAMANDAPDVLQCADLVAPSNRENGVAQILEQWFPQ